MKKKLLFFVLAPLFLLQTGCKKPTDGVKIYVDASVIHYNELLYITDASGTALPAGTSITVNIGGAAAANIYNNAGKKEFTVDENGMLNIGLDPAAEPTGTTPVSFTVSLAPSGYLPVTRSLKFYKGQMQNIAQLKLINPSSTISGMSKVLNNSTALTSNALSAPLSISTSGGTQSCAVALPSGTHFLDANSSLISGSALNVNILNFDVQNPTSSLLLPGGKFADSVSGLNTNGAAVYIEPAAFSNITMDVAGTTVKHFDKPINITLTLDPNTHNPLTNQAVQAGDSLQILSYDDGSAKWAYESTGFVTNNSGTLQLTFSSTHLTWFGTAWATVTHNCTAGVLTINLVNAPASMSNSSLGVVVYFDSDPNMPALSSYFLLTNFSMSSGGGFVKVIPDYTAKIKLVFIDIGGGKKIDSTDWVLPCSSYTINVNWPSNQTVITGNFIGTCANSADKIVRPSLFLIYSEVGKTSNTGFLFVQNGYISTTALQIGHTYNFVGMVGTSPVGVPNFTIDKTNYQVGFDMPATSCNF